jgi:hypothetical protein
VQPRRRLAAEQLRQQRLARRRRQQIDAAHDLGDAHLEIVDDDRELIGVDAVAALEDEVATSRDVW